MESIIELQNIHFEYSESKPLLKNLSFHLKEGEKIALTGKNGTGKTTLFHIIMGLLPIKSGKIYLFGKLHEK